MENRSLGLIETRGYVAAVEAADVATKASNVRLIGYEHVDPGLVTVKLAGDVAAVQAAVSAAAAAAAKVGEVVAVLVIARPDRQVPVFTEPGPPAPVIPGTARGATAPAPAASQAGSPPEATKPGSPAGTRQRGKPAAPKKPKGRARKAP